MQPHALTSAPPRSAATWLGFAAGLIATPLLALGFAHLVTAWYGGDEAGSEHALAVTSTRALTEALDRYRTRHQRMPDTRIGLAALVPDFLDQLPSDPWGRAFVYEMSGETAWADVLSYGADGAPGGVGSAADVSGRFGRLGPRPPALVDALGRLALLLCPIAALMAARRWRWGIGLLAGMAALWAVLLLASLGMPPHNLRNAYMPLIVGMACLTASVALLRQARGAPALACGAAVAASLLLGHLITG